MMMHVEQLKKEKGEKERTARQCLEKIFDEKFNEQQRQNFVKTLQKIKDVIPDKTPDKKIKQLEELKSLIPDDVYQKAKENIVKDLNGFSVEEVKKLKYYVNVIETLIKALEPEEEPED